MKDFVRNHVITPALQAIHAYSDDALDMVYVTGVTESLYQHVRQSGGPALGWFQMEPVTHDDIWRNYLGPTSREYLVNGLQNLSRRPGMSQELEVNPWYAAAMCRIHYLRNPESLPMEGKRTSQALYWKNWYNTKHGKGTPEKFLEHITYFGD